jgi:hypothetical protein
MLRRVALVRPDVSEERITSIIRVTTIDEVGKLAITITRCTLRRNVIVFLRRVRRLLVTANFVPIPSIVVNLMTEAIRSSETSGLTRVKQCNILEDEILHSHRRENVKSYMISVDIRIMFNLGSSYFINEHAHKSRSI